MVSATFRSLVRPLVALLLLTGASTASASAFGPGEQSILRIDFAGIPAGQASVTVGAPTKVGTQPVWPIVTVAETESVFSVFPVKDKFVSWWDLGAGRSVGYDFFATESGKSRRERAKFHATEDGKVRVQRVKETGEQSSRDYDTDPTAQDITAAFFAMRSRPLATGDTLTLQVFSGARTWPMTITVGAPEKLTVPAGTWDALPLDISVQFSGKLEAKRSLKGWVSADERHTLLKMSAELILGSINAELTEYRPGNDGVKQSARLATPAP